MSAIKIPPWDRNIGIDDGRTTRMPDLVECAAVGGTSAKTGVVLGSGGIQRPYACAALSPVKIVLRGSISFQARSVAMTESSSAGR